MRLLYSALYYCLLPLLVLRTLWRSRRAVAYRQRLPERFGLFSPRPDLSRPAIWVHAVSVGETLAAAPLVETLLQQYPAHRLVITTTTPTGSERVRALFGDRVFHVYLPWDLPGCMSRFLARTHPALLLIMETELWPNMLHYSRAAGCRIMLVNARMSERSARGYSRLGGLTQSMLQHLDTAACQTSTDSKRLLTLGLSPSALALTGSIKFDLALDDDLRCRVTSQRQALSDQGRPVVVAASTHADEEALILDAYRGIREALGECLLVLVPRHPERFDEVGALCRREGWQVVRRSAGTLPGAADDILLGDTMGELLLLLGCATVAIIGGSFLSRGGRSRGGRSRGGHNPLEAAAWGVPVVAGPDMVNFEDVSQRLILAGAMVQLEGDAGLAPCLIELLEDSTRRQSMGAAGQQVLADNRGATARVMTLVAEQLAGY
jgi:3-deoxy-D-manno-octulosonic-acid transferase